MFGLFNESILMGKSLQIVASNGFPEWLEHANLSIAFTTYRMGKLFLLGRKQGGQLSVFERTFNRSMGVWTDSQTLWLASAYQIWRFENMLESGVKDGAFDRLFVPMQSFTTGDINVHDVTVDAHGELFFASTLFSCVGKLSDQHSLTSFWSPPFISKLATEDRCHLNGMCCFEGQPKYVTACAATDTDHGWRANKKAGGLVVDMQTNETLVRGLSMPHSPRFANGKLWILNSGRGEFGYVDLRAGHFEPVALCPGFARGLAIQNNVAIVGLSKPRDETFAGLELDDELRRHDTQAHCGLAVIDLDRGEVVHQVHVLGDVEELYDVAVMPGVTCPKAFGMKADDVRHNVWLHDGQKTSRFTANERG